jgi:mannose-6-phosphate isomerase-like protein (cupin superfamily)
MTRSTLVLEARSLGEPADRPTKEVQMTTKATGGYAIALREDALDFMAEYPGYGEQRWYSDALRTEQVSFSWRRMPPGTGGRGSYGHRHPGQEEVYFVISGMVTFKVGDDVFEAGPQTAVRMTGQDFYSVHNDTGAEAELLVFSTRLADPPPRSGTASGRSPVSPLTGSAPRLGSRRPRRRPSSRRRASTSRQRRSLT